MFGFGKKKNSKQAAAPDMSAVHILTIPQVFYGGRDPHIYHHEAAHSDEKSMHTSKEKMQKKHAPVTKRHAQVTQKTIFSNKWTWIIGSVVLVCIAVVISWFYLKPYFDAQKNVQTPAQPQNTQTSNQTTPAISPTTTTTTNVTTTTQNSITSTTSTVELPSLTSEFIVFPPQITLDTSDLDSDDLTDIEEELFDTDSGTWDSDDDGYYDGQEVTNLYNPRGFSPVRLIDSGLISEYVHPSNTYRLYYPQVWQRGSVDANSNQVLFSAISGDYIEVRISQKTGTTQNFVTWFGRNAEGQKFTDLREFKNRFGVTGWVRKDNLVAYFEDSSAVYVFVYHPLDNAPIAYRQVMQMMYESFRLSADSILPDQTPRITTSTPRTATSTQSTTSTIN